MKRRSLMPAMMLSLVLLTGSSAGAFAQTSQLTVMTDSSSYETGDTITIKGDVGAVTAEQLLIQVWNS